MAKYIVAGVGTAQLFKSGYTDYIGSTKTLTESGLSFTVSEEEVRGGLGNSVLGSYFHDTGFTLNMTDALFSLEYLAMNVGGQILSSADVVTTEQLTVAGGKIKPTSTPVEMFKGTGTIGWVKTPAQSEDDWTRVVFTNGEVAVDYVDGTVLCVRYCKEDASARKFKISSNFIPDQISLILTLPLFKAGTEKAQSYTNSSKVGEIQIRVPNFIFNGAQDMSLSASGIATTSLSGKALATFTGSEGCDDEGYYGEIIEVIYGKSEWDDVKNIVVINADLDMKVGDVHILEVSAIYNGNTAPKPIDNSKLTITSSDTSVATVDATGKVTALSSGVANIEVVVTDEANLSSYAVATVTV